MAWAKRIVFSIASIGLISFCMGLTDPNSSAQVAIIETGESRPWQSPNYDEQKNALGYNDSTFQVPDGLKDRVQFWVRVYSEITTSEGFLHDQDGLVVYQKLDFGDIMTRSDINESQKEKLRRARVKQAKELLSTKLAHFDSVTDPSTLSDEDQKIYKTLDGNSDPKRFRAAAQTANIRFQLGQKDRFLQGIYYSGRYLSDMEKIFESAGLPKELTRLPFVESSFNILAMSRVGASGIWQIMPSTGRMYKLRLDTRMDERNDPWQATAAASRILKFNHEFLGNWGLALTAYNHGPAGVKKLTQTVGSKDIVDIIQRGKGRRFGFASENFFACFLAALEVERNAKNYFSEVKWGAPLAKAEIRLASEVPWNKVVEWFDNNEELARLYNPHVQYRVRSGAVRIPATHLIRVPEKNLEVATSWMKDSPNVAVASFHTEKKASIGGALNAEKDKTYRVHRGDTLGRIASKFRVSIQDLTAANNIGNSRRLRVGQKLVIPD